MLTLSLTLPLLTIILIIFCLIVRTLLDIYWLKTTTLRESSEVAVKYQVPSYCRRPGAKVIALLHHEDEALTYQGHTGPR